MKEIPEYNEPLARYKADSCYIVLCHTMPVNGEEHTTEERAIRHARELSSHNPSHYFDVFKKVCEVKAAPAETFLIRVEDN